MNIFKNRIDSHKNKGVTLIELLLYIALSAMILLVSSVFLSLLIRSRIKNQTIAEIGQQGTQIMQLMTHAIRNADNINSPTQGSSGTTLSLETSLGSTNPTVFQFSGGRIQMREGSGSLDNISSSRVTVSDLSFQNLSRAGTPGNIKINFTLTHNNPSGQNEYSFARTFTASSSLRYP